MSSTELLIGFFVFVITTISAAGYAFVLRPSRVHRDVDQIPAVLTMQPDMPASEAVVLEMFRLIGEALPGNRAQAESTRQKLIAAGYRWPSAVSIFFGLRIGSALLFTVAAIWTAMLSCGTPSAALIPMICGLGFGYMIPDRVLAWMAKARAERLRKGLPAALDLMVLAVESGQGLDAAILETSRGLHVSHPDLASEFTQLQLELRANTARMDAVRNFGARTRDAELRKFSSLLIETDRFGSSLGPALRSHAKYLRTRLRQKAQENARKVSVKLIFPIFFLIFPSVILVTLGPAVILVMGQLNSIFGN